MLKHKTPPPPPPFSENEPAKRPFNWNKRGAYFRNFTVYVFFIPVVSSAGYRDKQET